MRKVAALTAIVVGIIMAIAGVLTWVVVSNTLGDQRITVSDDANCAAGDDVNGPISAYCQADIIDHHTQAITGGKTYDELPQDDPNRVVAMDSAFLQASLFTSVVAFGVAGMVFVLGIVLTLIGLGDPRALHRLATARRQSVSPGRLRSRHDGEDRGMCGRVRFGRGASRSGRRDHVQDCWRTSAGSPSSMA